MYIFIIVGTILMCACSIWQSFIKNISVWKAIILSVCFTLFGTLGAFLLYFVETGSFGGISFMGSIMLIPIFSIPLKYILKIKYSIIIDIVVPQICLMLFVMKIHCMIGGCCYGITCYVGDNSFIFPSQIVEGIMSLIFAVVFMLLQYKNIANNLLYPIYFIAYGIFRFCFNFLRGGLTPFIGICPAGHFWAILLFITGTIWLVILLILNKKKGKVKNV